MPTSAPWNPVRAWIWRKSRAPGLELRVVEFDPTDGFEYDAHPDPSQYTFFQIDPQRDQWREVDASTGQALSGPRGVWRPTKSVSWPSGQ